MKHVEFLRENGSCVAEHGRKSILTRTQGSFYTHPTIGHHLISAILDVDRPFVEKGSFSIIDPFCGDGRLVCWLLDAIARGGARVSSQVTVELWDCDASALAIARKQVKATALSRNIPLALVARHCDAFTRGPRYHGRYDIVVTNPPWDVLKPDRRELLDLDTSANAGYIRNLGDQQAYLESQYPVSRPAQRFSRWGLNLARCGTELAFRLASPNGIVGIVSPASLLADQVSEQLRRWILCNHLITDVGYFPAECRLFEGVDQPAITLVALCKQPEIPTVFSAIVTKYTRDAQVRERGRVKVPLSAVANMGHILPVHFSGAAVDFLSYWSRFPSFFQIERAADGFYAGRELDETRSETYLSDRGRYSFIKGRMVDRFRLLNGSVRYVRTELVRIPKSVEFTRVAWRDVSRPTQKRRMQATLIPPGCVTGNSLNILYFSPPADNRLYALLGIMNSLVFEFQLRTFSATAHVSLGSVRKVHLPWPLSSNRFSRIAAICERCLQGDQRSEVAMEIYVARLYGLSRRRFESILGSFDKLSETERGELLQRDTWDALGDE